MLFSKPRISCIPIWISGLSCRRMIGKIFFRV